MQKIETFYETPLHNPLKKPSSYASSGFCTTEYFESVSGAGGPADKFDLPGSNGMNSDVTCNNNNAFISIQGASATGNAPFTSNEFCGRVFNSIRDSSLTGIVRSEWEILVLILC